MTTANQRLKKRWSAAVRLSLLAALVVHGLLVWLAPSWSFPLRPSREEPGTFLRLIVVAQTTEADELEPYVIASEPPAVIPPKIEEIEELLLPDRIPLIEQRSIPPISRQLDVRRVVQPSPGRPSTAVIAPIAWPTISNPESMKQYMRERYNPLFTRGGVTGTVVLSLWVDERGVTRRVRLAESSGSELLDDIAVDTFQEVVTFRPARDGPHALAVQFDLSVPFLTEW